MTGQELIQMGLLQGKREGKLEGKTETALNLLKMGLLTDEQIAKAANLRSDEVKKLSLSAVIRIVHELCPSGRAEQAASVIAV